MRVAAVGRGFNSASPEVAAAVLSWLLCRCGDIDEYGRMSRAHWKQTCACAQQDGDATANCIEHHLLKALSDTVKYEIGDIFELVYCIEHPDYPKFFREFGPNDDYYEVDAEEMPLNEFCEHEGLMYVCGFADDERFYNGKFSPLPRSSSSLFFFLFWGNVIVRCIAFACSRLQQITRRCRCCCCCCFCFPHTV